MIHHRRKKSPASEDINYFISVSDLMAGALMIILLMFAGYVISRIKSKPPSLDLIQVEPPVWTEPEANRTEKLVFRIPEPAKQDWVIWCQSEDGTAKAGYDYLPVSGELVFHRGKSTAELTVSLMPDAMPEDTESFLLVLKNPGTKETPRKIQARILDTDKPDSSLEPLMLSVGDATIPEPVERPATVTIQVRLDRETDVARTINLVTKDHTAKAADLDFEPQATSVNFMRGQSNATVDVVVLPDQNRQEGNESFFLSVSGGYPGIVVAKSRGEITITDPISQDKPEGDEDPIFTQIQLDREDLLERLKDGMEKAGFDVEHNKKNGVLRFPATLLFKPGKAEIKSEKGSEALGMLGKLLEREVSALMSNHQRHKLEAIYLEGHTDNVRVRFGAKFVDNWDLSVARATNSYRAMLKGAPKLADLKNAENKALLSVSGYGEERPIENNHNANDDERTANRRIDLRFVMAPPPIEVYRGIRK